MYTAYYQLKESPFRLTPDPRFLHLANPHLASLQALLQVVLLRKGFAVFVGPVGTGKTTVLHAALHVLTQKSALKETLASAFLVNPTLTRDEFLEALLDEFEIPCTSTSKPKRLAALHDMLLDTQRRGGTAVLIVDEAHLLSTELLEEIRLLSNTDTYQEKLLQIILCGQPELFSLLLRPEMRALQQRIGTTCSLRPLSLPEARAYVAERLHAADLRGPSPFLDRSLGLIFTYSKGVPRLINLLCDSCLTIGFAEQAPKIDVAIVEEAAARLGLLEAPPTTARPAHIPAPLYQRGNGEGSLTAVDVLIDSLRQQRQVSPRE